MIRIFTLILNKSKEAFASLPEGSSVSFIIIDDGWVKFISLCKICCWYIHLLPNVRLTEGSLNLKITDNDDDRRPFFVSACIIESDMAIFNAATCLNLTFSKGIC